MTSLTELRRDAESGRFAREHINDTPRIRAPLDTDALAAALRSSLRGEVRFDDGSRALYATDGSNYRQVPIGVVIPRDLDDVIHAMPGQLMAHRKAGLAGADHHDLRSRRHRGRPASQWIR